jgi:FHA domain-containing protein
MTRIAWTLGATSNATPLRADYSRVPVASLDISAILRALERERFTGTLAIPAGEIDLADGKPVAAFCGAATGRAAFDALKLSGIDAFTFTARAARAANIVAEQPRGVRASLSMLAGRTVPRLDLVTREQLLRRGVFAPKPPTVLDEPPAADNVWRLVPLGTLANALIAEYAKGAYGGRAWDSDIGTRFAAVPERPLPPVAVTAGAIDLAALAVRTDLDDVVPFLRGLIRAIYGEAARTVGDGAARRGVRASVTRLWGAHERVLAAATRIVEERPPAPARLVATRTLTGMFRVVERDYVVGRATGSDIALVHPSVSRRHLRITPSEGAHLARDLGSTSGTLLNGAKLTDARPLHDGDTLELGEVAVRYERV